MLRLKTQIWIQAYLRRCMAEGLYGAVVHKGNEEAGAVYVTVNRLDGTGHLFAPAPGPAYDENGDRRFHLASPDPEPVAAIEAKVKRRLSEDPDMWIVEVEDRKGQGLLAAAKD